MGKNARLRVILEIDSESILGEFSPPGNDSVGMGKKKKVGWVKPIYF